MKYPAVDDLAGPGRQMYQTWARAEDSGRVGHVTARGLPDRRPGPGAGPLSPPPLASAVPGRPAACGKAPAAGFPEKIAGNRDRYPGGPTRGGRAAGRSGRLDFLGRPQVSCKRYNLDVLIWWYAREERH